MSKDERNFEFFDEKVIKDLSERIDSEEYCPDDKNNLFNSIVKFLYHDTFNSNDNEMFLKLDYEFNSIKRELLEMSGITGREQDAYIYSQFILCNLYDLCSSIDSDTPRYDSQALLYMYCELHHNGKVNKNEFPLPPIGSADDWMNVIDEIIDNEKSKEIFEDYQGKSKEKNKEKILSLYKKECNNGKN